MPAVLISPEAERDIHEAYNWYESQREGLGKELLLCIEVALDQIERNPQASPLVYRDLHRALIRRFPYGLLYLIGKSSVVIIAMFHGKVHPRRWGQRRRLH